MLGPEDDEEAVAVLKTDGKRVPVRVVVDDSITSPAFAIAPEGECTLTVGVAAATVGRDKLRNHLLRYIDAFLNPLPANTYARVSINREDYNYLASGTHHGSINHANGEPEGGLSVALWPEYPAPYGYYVTGTVLYNGTDGEPVLDVATAKPVSRLMTWRQLQADYNRKLARRVKALGLTEEERRLLVSGAYLVF